MRSGPSRRQQLLELCSASGDHSDFGTEPTLSPVPQRDTVLPLPRSQACNSPGYCWQRSQRHLHLGRAALESEDPAPSGPPPVLKRRR